jgi:hypothetical protein
MTTKEDIRGWLERGLEDGATHIIVVCDTFDYEDYPVYVEKGQNVKEIARKYDGKNMQKIMEVYDLSLPIEEQLNKKRSYNL